MKIDEKCTGREDLYPEEYVEEYVPSRRSKKTMGGVSKTSMHSHKMR